MLSSTAQQPPLPIPLVFGTYRLRGEVLDDSACQAMQIFRQQGRSLLLDGASKYQNTDAMMRIMLRFPTAEIGWKVEAKSSVKDLNAFVNALKENGIPYNRVFRILMHNYSGKKSFLEFQHLVDETFGKEMMPIGICNITTEQLHDLLAYDHDGGSKECTQKIGEKNPRNPGAAYYAESSDQMYANVETFHILNNLKIRVNYVQNEYHPFVQTDVPKFCNKHGIHFEAHSTMWGNLEDYETILKDIILSEPKEDDQQSAKGGCNDIRAAWTLSNQPSGKTFLPQKIAQLAIAYAANSMVNLEPDEYTGNTNERQEADELAASNSSESSEKSMGQKQVEDTAASSVKESETNQSNINTCMNMSVCFTTSNYSHLVDICNTRQISVEFLKRMRQMCTYKRVIRYKGSGLINTDWIKSCDEEYIKWKVLPQLKKDINVFYMGQVPSDLCTKIPKHYRKNGKQVHSIIAKHLYLHYLDEREHMTKNEITSHYFGKGLTGRDIKQSDDDSMEEGRPEFDCNDVAWLNQHLSPLLKKMRQRLNGAVTDAKNKKKVATCTIKAVTNPEALPVDSFPDASEFDDLNEYIIKMSHMRIQRYQDLSRDQHPNQPSFFSGTISNNNIRFKYGTVNKDGRLDLCKQGVKNAYVNSCDAVIADAEESNVRFQHGTLNSDGRLDLCKQGVKNAYVDSCDAVVKDGSSNVLFKHGTMNEDGRLDLCKQGIKNASVQICNAVIHDVPNDNTASTDNSNSNIRFKHGTLNSDGRLDLCKQGVKTAYVNTCDAVVQDGSNSNVRFKYGTLNNDGRLDLCKQGVRNAYANTCDAVVQDGNSNSTANAITTNVRFKHGTVNEDGRLDLCKQGVKKAYVDSCNAVHRDGDFTGSSTPLIKHYLLGNNLIGDDSDGLADVRIAALCNMIRKRPDIITWFLAGNELKHNAIKLIADSFLNSTAKYLWFKMNPIKDSCCFFAHLIQNNSNIELLDLFNCGICDSGVFSFYNALIKSAEGQMNKNKKMNAIADKDENTSNSLSKNENEEQNSNPVAECYSGSNMLMERVFDTHNIPKEETTKNKVKVSEDIGINYSRSHIPTLLAEVKNGDAAEKQEQLVHYFRALNFSNLKHIYFAINNITEYGMSNALFYVLAILSNTLESIYVTSNPIKDTGLKTFYTKMVTYGVTFPKLKRLNFGSCGLTDESLSNLTEIVKMSPNLVSLELGSYRSTNYFGQLDNQFTDTDKLFEIAKHLKINAINCGEPDKVFIGFQHAFVMSDSDNEGSVKPGETEMTHEGYTKKELDKICNADDDPPMIIGTKSTQFDNLCAGYTHDMDANEDENDRCIEIEHDEDGDIQDSSENSSPGDSTNQVENSPDDKMKDKARDDNVKEQVLDQEQKVIPSGVPGVSEKWKAEVNALIKRMVDELGMNVNGIQSRKQVGIQGGSLVRQNLSKRELAGVKHPYPAVDYIQSIYRNTMKV